jgi:hypothetical protein
MVDPCGTSVSASEPYTDFESQIEIYFQIWAWAPSEFVSKIVTANSPRMEVARTFSQKLTFKLFKAKFTDCPALFRIE